MKPDDSREPESPLPTPPPSLAAADLLVPYADGELSLADVARVDALLATSPELRARLAQHRRVAELMDRWRQSAAPDAAACLASVRVITLDRAIRAARWRRCAWLTSAAALTILLLVATPWRRAVDDRITRAGGGARSEEPSEDVLHNLPVLEDMLEAIEKQDAELTPELIRSLLEETDVYALDGAANDGVGDDPSLLEYFLEEELSAENL